MPKIAQPKAAVKPARAASANPLVDDEDDEAPVPKRSKGARDVIHDEKVWIILEENKEIPPTGQFIGINGRSWMLRPGVPAQVPRAILNVLNDAVKSVPVMDMDGNKIIEYRNASRLPYRLLTAEDVKRFQQREQARV